tara:strand:- start:6125 stop:6823 length:699 start_codon:yes stop_codon:yes gene_type:complete
MYKVYDFMNDEDNVINLAKELAEAFIEKGNSNTIEYNFDLSAGRVKSKEQNTFFSFDTQTGTLIQKFKEVQFDEDLKDISKKDEQQLQKDIFEFSQLVCKEISEAYSIELKKKIRETVLSHADETIYPLETVQAQDIEIMDYSSSPEPSKYLLKIKKNQGVPLSTDKITIFVHERQEETGQTVEEVFEEQKNINPLFENVEGLERGNKFLYDVTLTFFVDYSLNQEAAPQKT